MASKGVNIPIAADASSVVQEAKKVEDAFTDVSDSLDDLDSAGADASNSVQRNTEKMADDLSDVSKAAKTAGDDIKHEISSGADAAKGEADPLARKFKDDLDSISTKAKTTGSDVGAHLKRGAEEAGEGTATLKENAQANLKETAASFDGTIDSFAGGVQGLAAEALEGFGPIGLAGGAVLTAVAGAFYNSWKNNAEKTKQVVSDMFDDMIASGENFLSEDYIQQQVSKIVKGEDGAPASFNQAKSLAGFAGINVGTALRALAGDTEAVTKARAGLAEAEDHLRDRMASSNDTTDATRLEIAAETKVIDGLKGKLDGTSEAQEKATAATQAARQAQKSTASAVRDANDAHASYNATVKGLNGTLADNAKNIRDQSERLTANRAAVDSVASAGEDWISKMRTAGASSKDLARAQEQVYDDVVAAGEAMGLSKDKAEDYADQILDIPTSVKTTAKLDLEGYKDTHDRLNAIGDALDRIKSKTITVSIKGGADTQARLDAIGQAAARAGKAKP